MIFFMWIMELNGYVIAHIFSSMYEIELLADDSLI